MAHRNSVVSRLLATVFASGLLASFGMAASASAEPERAADGAVVVRASGETMDGIGAGTIVAVAGDSVTVLTAKHVATFGPLSIRFPDGTRAAAHIVSLVHDRDLALVAASVEPAFATTLHAAPVGRPTRHLPVHVWGSGTDGPAFEPAAVNTVGATLPDGAKRARYTISCALCHQGDSGAGVFDERGELVGVYVGFFEMETGRLSVVEEPLDETALAAYGVVRRTIARTNFSSTPSNPLNDGGSVVAATFPRAK